MAQQMQIIHFEINSVQDWVTKVLPYSYLSRLFVLWEAIRGYGLRSLSCAFLVSSSGDLRL